jgi:cyclopropane fatty-acyl-phospholipid synthase-like methyltransferase
MFSNTFVVRRVGRAESPARVWPAGQRRTALMTAKIAERLVWAVETMQVRPDGRVLEIGCGAGVAVGLVCERLVDGRITAIDRSEAMTALASRRNREHVASGRAV